MKDWRMASAALILIVAALAGIVVVARRSANEKAGDNYYLEGVVSNQAITEANKLEGENKDEEAINRLQSGLNDSSNNNDRAAINITLGSTYLRQRQYEEAVAAFAQADRQEKITDSSALLSYATALRRLSDFNHAAIIYTRTIEVAEKERKNAAAPTIVGKAREGLDVVSRRGASVDNFDRDYIKIVGRQVAASYTNDRDASKQIFEQDLAYRTEHKISAKQGNQLLEVLTKYFVEDNRKGVL